MRKSVGGTNAATACTLLLAWSTGSGALSFGGCGLHPCMSERCPPADAPTMPRRFGSTPYSLAFVRMNLTARFSCGMISVIVYFGWLAKYDEVFGLGTTRRQVSRGFYRELRKLDRSPAAGVIGPDELTDVMTSAGY